MAARAYVAKSTRNCKRALAFHYVPARDRAVELSARQGKSPRTQKEDDNGPVLERHCDV
jgi:hypothetical protein